MCGGGNFQISFKHLKTPWPTFMFCLSLAGTILLNILIFVGGRYYASIFNCNLLDRQNRGNEQKNCTDSYNKNIYSAPSPLPHLWKLNWCFWKTFPYSHCSLQRTQNSKKRDLNLRFPQISSMRSPYDIFYRWNGSFDCWKYLTDFPIWSIWSGRAWIETLIDVLHS